MSEARITIVCESVNDPSITAHCPRCGYGPLDGYTCIKEKSPDEARKNLSELIEPPVVKAKAGDVMICWKCGAILIYAMLGGQLNVRAMNRKELAGKKRNAEQWEMALKMRRIVRMRDRR